MTISNYNDTFLKRFLDITVSTAVAVVAAPVAIFFVLMIKFASGSPVLFLQKRVGKGGRVFKIIKFRTMVINADKIQGRYLTSNESDGPVFKITNDPRFTKIGKILSRTGLDELPQLVNVLRGEMSLVGPRPLPTGEAGRLTKSQKVRELVKPGITSTWVVEGSHNLTFAEWMRLDREYVENASFKGDVLILFRTVALVVRFVLNLVLSK